MALTQAEFKMLIAAVILFVIDVLLLIIWGQASNITVDVEPSLDIVLLSRGRNREDLQIKLWQKYFQPNYPIHFYILHTSNHPITNKNNNQEDYKIKRIQTNSMDERDIFLNINNYINQKRSPKFIWASDTVVPIQLVNPTFFERHKGLNGARFFNGFNADATLLNIHDIYEKTIPVGYIEYEKLAKLKSWSVFINHFLTSRHNVFTNASQDLLLPNRKNRAKRKESRELFQVAHISPHETNPETREIHNNRIKEIWGQYINE